MEQGRNIILCGFMGCGKTTVGKRVAARTGRRFVDMDEFITQQAGMSVSEIFARLGEADFRRREREACRELAGERDCVIATGGGALIFPENVEALAGSGPIVLLDVAPEVLLLRLAGDKTRPLLAGPDREEKFWSLYRARLPLYRRAASVQVSIGRGVSPAAAAERVLTALKEAGREESAKNPMEPRQNSSQKTVDKRG